MCFDHVRPRDDRARQAGRRQIHPTQPGAQPAHVQIRLGELRAISDCLFILTDRIGRLSLVRKAVGEVETPFGVTRFDRQRLAKLGLRLIVLLLLCQFGAGVRVRNVIVIGNVYRMRKERVCVAPEPDLVPGAPAEHRKKSDRGDGQNWRAIFPSRRQIRDAPHDADRQADRRDVRVTIGD